MPQDDAKAGLAASSSTSQQQIMVVEIQDRFGMLFLDYK
jgi:hypothetical protein